MHVGALDLTARIRALREEARPPALSPAASPLAASLLQWLEASRGDARPPAPSSHVPKTASAPELSETLRKLLEVREADIARLREGSDAAVVRRFLIRFIKVHQATVDIVADGEASLKDVELLRDLLSDSLEASGVSAFSPPLGSDYRTAVGVEGSPKVVENADPARSYTIATVVRSGYVLDTAEGPAVLVPAKVRVYQPVEGSNDG